MTTAAISSSGGGVLKPSTAVPPVISAIRWATLGAFLDLDRLELFVSHIVGPLQLYALAPGKEEGDPLGYYPPDEYDHEAREQQPNGELALRKPQLPDTFGDPQVDEQLCRVDVREQSQC